MVDLGVSVVLFLVSRFSPMEWHVVVVCRELARQCVRRGPLQSDGVAHRGPRRRAVHRKQLHHLQQSWSVTWRSRLQL